MHAKLKLKHTFDQRFLDLHTGHTPSLILPIDEEEDTNTGKHKNELSLTTKNYKKGEKQQSNRKFNPYPGSKVAVVLKKFRSTDDCSMSKDTLEDVPPTISAIIQPASSTVSLLDVTKGKDITFSNYHVTCETNNKGNTKREVEDRCNNTIITDF